MIAAWFAGVALGFPMIGDVDFGAVCRPIPQGAERWWAEGEPGHALALVTVDVAEHPRALCNDGTAATYYVRPGSDPSRWIVHLQGGGACQSESECAARWCYTPASDYSGEMMSSAFSHPTLYTGGITDPDPVLNRFSSFNHVFVHYCSSDFFLGRTADVDLENLVVPEHSFRVHFLGQDILDAVLTELRQTPPSLVAQAMPSLDDASQVLLTGTTSGAVGVVHNLDRVAALLRETNPAVDVRGVIDSAAYPAADTTGGGPYTGIPDPAELWKYEALGANNDLFGGELDASCVASELALTEPWWCTERMHVLTHQVETPFFVYSDQLDVENPLCQGDPACVPEWIEQFNAFSLVATPLPGRPAPPQYPADAPLPGYVLPRCATHAVLAWRDSIGFLHRKVPLDGYVPGASTWVSFHDALWSWVEGDGGETTALRSIDAAAPGCPDPPPSAVVGLVAVADETARTVALSWTPTPFATAETVFWADAGAPVSTASPSAPPTSAAAWLDAGPFLSPERCYAVNAQNGEGTGPLSAPVCVALPWVAPVEPDPADTGGEGSDPPPATDADGGGCGCASGRPGAAWLAAPLLLLVRRRTAVLAMVACAGDDPTSETARTTPPAPLTPPVADTASPPANVLLVIADDVGIDRLATWPNPASAAFPPPPTPNIDALAAAGIAFDTAYAASSCSPSRAMVVTGRYPRDTGIGYPHCADIPSVNALSLDETTIPEILRPRGYTSRVVGKWHLASAQSYADNAMAHGFDGHRGTVCTFTEPALSGGAQGWYDWEKNVDGALQRATTYATVDTTDDAIDAIRTLPEPWFVLLAYNAAHAPWVAPPDALYTLPTVVDGESTWLQAFDAMVEAMDTELGRVIAELDRTDLADRTTVVFTSDNGTPHPVAADAWLEVGGKFTGYESGVRVPLIVRGPDVAVPGSRTPVFANLVDLLPTIAELAGVEALDPALGLRGRSLVPFLRDPNAADDRTHLYAEGFLPVGPPPYTEFHRSLRDERYKLLVDDDATGTTVAFFDLYADGNPLGWEGVDLLLGDPDGVPDDPAAAAAFGALLALLEADYGLDRVGGLVPR